MRKEQKDVDGLGPIGILREAFKVMSTHSRFFLQVQFMLYLPVAFLAVTIEFLVYRNLPGSNLPPGGSKGIPTMPINALHGGEGGVSLVVAVVALLLVSAVVAMVLIAAVGLPYSAVLYAAGLNYTGQSISFKDVLRASLPLLWMRLTLTFGYKVLILYSFLISQSVLILVLVQNKMPIAAVLLVAAVAVVLLVVVSFILDIIFMLAAGRSVLEKDFGWAALRRTPRLLKGRWTVAVLLQLLLMVPLILTVGLQHNFQSQILKGNFSRSRLVAFLLTTGVYLFCESFGWQLRAVCAGVQYASFKAYHNEDLEECFYEKQSMKSGYERVGGEGDHSYLVGPKAEAFV